MLIFNQSIVSGKFPEGMKLVDVIPLYQGKETDLIVNYHPISLLITISKVLEEIIHKCVYNFLEREQILYSSQYGFCARHSCEQAITELTGRLIAAHDSGLHSAGVFLDSSKAFNILNHKKLENYGIRGISNAWFKS